MWQSEIIVAVANTLCNQRKKFAWICDACRRIGRPIRLDSRSPPPRFLPVLLGQQIKLEPPTQVARGMWGIKCPWEEVTTYFVVGCKRGKQYSSTADLLLSSYNSLCFHTASCYSVTPQLRIEVSSRCQQQISAAASSYRSNQLAFRYNK